MCGCVSRAPYWGPGPQPRHVSWLGIELENLWFTGPHSIHWATPARAQINTFKKNCSKYIDMVVHSISRTLIIYEHWNLVPIKQLIPISLPQPLATANYFLPLWIQLVQTPCESGIPGRLRGRKGTACRMHVVTKVTGLCQYLRKCT